MSMNTPQRKFWWEAKLSLLTALETAHRVTRSQLACEATKIVLLALNERVFVSENLVCYRREHDNFNLERLFFFYSTSCNQYFELLRCSLVHMSYVWLMRDAIAGTRNRELRKEKKKKMKCIIWNWVLFYRNHIFEVKKNKMLFTFAFRDFFFSKIVWE